MAHSTVLAAAGSPRITHEKRSRCRDGGIATGEKTIEETGWDLFRLILDVASGRTQPWSDRWGIHNDLTLFNPAPVT
ncbi:UxaA family hydrolase [Bradyrhizobium sp. SSUT77]|uniref:UxaA family hydrolase n=1 Tax=Bradyrhizobium sp. SSUT77 TaxID=3040603 RepID=UPI0024482CA4|nr:UxaA family hydrolase [Bradyrhizobium sp. SSUT77]MDH2344237.1 UxaA family hydrolase [Bradyrhizobium sp. SSUT77]